MPVYRVTRALVLNFICLCCFPAIAMAGGGGLVLTNDDGFAYDIRLNTGELNDGSGNGLSDACDGCWELQIDGTTYDPAGIFTLDLSGREATFPVQNMSGLDVVRRLYVPQESNFIRYLNVLTNPTGADITVQVNYDTNLGSDSNTIIVNSSSGDDLATLEDFWVVTGGDSSDPAVTHLWDGLGGIDRVDTLFLSAPGGDAVDWGWTDVTVPAGATVIYMTLGVMTEDPADGSVAAGVLFNLALVQMSVNLDETALSQLQNWQFTDTDGDGLFDGYEVFYGLDPNDATDAASDNDMDGLTALEEFNSFTDPTDADSDDDGLSDGDEVNIHGTNPNNSDSDSDGIGDGGEVNTGGDPLDPEDASSTLTALSSIEDAWEPRGATDSEGNTHLVWVQDSRLGVPLDEFSYDGYEIYYSLLDSTGGTLIGATRLTNNIEIDVRPRIAVDSTGRAVIIWQSMSNVVLMARVDPATDDQNGDAADPVTLLGVGPIVALTTSRHATLALDAADNVHVYSQQSNYAKFDIDGMALIAETSLGSPGGSHGNPDAKIDGDGNMHVVYTRRPILPMRGGGGADELHYLMVDGSTGTKLIDDTLLTVDDGMRAKHATVNLDEAGLLHVVFGSAVDATDGCSGGEIFRLVLDPSLDDQSGDAADPAVIRTVDPIMLSADDGRHSWYSWSGMNADGDIEITWNDGVTCRNGFGDRGRTDDLRRMVIDTAGNVVVPPSTLTENATGGTGNRYTLIAGGQAFWSQFRDGFDTIVVRNLNAIRLETATGTGLVRLSNDSGNISSAEGLTVADLPADAQAMAPRNIAFPDGLFRVVIDTALPGDTVAMALNLPTATDTSTVYYKWDLVNGWQQFPFTQGATANDIILSLTDGGAGDADGIANGQIVDPGGPGSNTNVAPTFTSMPAFAATEGSAYSYAVTVTDGNAGDTLTLAATTLPAWLTFVDNGDGTATLTGTPAAANVGANTVALTATDNAAIPAMAAQNFVIPVTSLVPPTVPTTVSGSGGGSGSTTPWMLLVASGLLYMRNRRTLKGAR